MSSPSFSKGRYANEVEARSRTEGSTTLLASQLYRLASRRRWVRGQGPLLLRPPALQIASLASIALLEAIASLASLASLGLVLRS